VTGKNVLELGCGYGTFVQEAEKAGKDALGLDIDIQCLKRGRNLYLSRLAKLVQGDMDCLPFKDQSFHTVVLRESLHHVTWERMLSEILRVCRREIIIFEPNPNWVLRLCRRIISHQDQEIPLETLLNVLKEHGVVIQGAYFRDFLAFPLSGGFVGWEFIPPIKFLFSLLIWVDRMLQVFFHLLRIEKAVCWRYLVKGILK
jgi:ubiquinone/menaquinone biosynthesis C-methylase UbiE